MKHIFKKLHFGSSHDPNRSNEVSPSPAISPSCDTDHRATSGTSPAASPTSSSSSTPITSAPPVAVSTAAASGADRPDYFYSEEEYQVQLALAISASNSEFRDGFHDVDDDQIYEAKILSLGRHGIGSGVKGNGAAEVLSRRYWDYNVLDYEEKVVDGFYDIYGLSTDPASEGKMPSITDIQANLGNPRFEVVVVNRVVDHNLEELHQVAQCIALDCPAKEIDLLAQRLADLVTEHMGGPVRDANVMLARWIDKSTELRTTLHTTILPIGSLNVGLSRHRALLFKVLADNVGVPCRLVKGSHYTGIDDDAVNLIKLDNEREFLVDLMGAPGTLIPADILSVKDTSFKSFNPILSRNPSLQTSNDFGLGLPRLEPPNSEHKAGNGKSMVESRGAHEKNSNSETTNLAPSSSTSSGLMPTNTGDSSGNLKTIVPSYQSSSASSSAFENSSPYKGKLKDPGTSDGVKDKLNVIPKSQETMDDPKNLFADLNPFQLLGPGKMSMQNKTVDNKVNDFQRWRDNPASGPGRPPVPMMWKNRSNRNEIPRTKQYDFVEGLFPRINQEVKPYNSSLSASSSSVPAGRGLAEFPNSNVLNAPGVPYPAGIVTNAGSTSPGHNVTAESNTGQYNRPASEEHANQRVKPHSLIYSQAPKNQEVCRENDEVLENDVMGGLAESRKNVMARHDRRKCINDRYMDNKVISAHAQESSSPINAGPARLDPMLDDVAECEILWEDLVIGERIGLGSYGEVYHADWKGTEVAVKKFLDQDFYGDALDEFRREVRIMRRLRHPNVVLFLGAVTRPPNLSIITEFLPRGSLYRILHRPNCQIDEKRRIKMALDVAKGMNCLHTSIPPVVHRDLKSPNLLVDKNWNVKVCDFGLSRLKHHTFLSSKSTAGTPEWMAPEVLRNEPSNEKCDIYSFGVILWELATLRMPWSGMNPMQVVGAVGFQNRRLDIPKEIDPVVATMIWECWQTDPNLRPSFEQLTSALKPLQRLIVPSNPEPSSSLVPQEVHVNTQI